jgi:hypothetical protein
MRMTSKTRNATHTARNEVVGDEPNIGEFGILTTGEGKAEGVM